MLSSPVIASTNRLPAKPQNPHPEGIPSSVSRTIRIQDHVHFRGQATLAAKYGIDPAQVRVEPLGTPLPVEKSVLIEKILEAHEQARKNQLLGNYSSRYFASSILLQNGTWGVAANIEMSRDRVLCGERSSIVTAWNQALRKLPLKHLENVKPDVLQQIQNGMKVKLLTFAQGDKVESNWAACAECLSWMATDRYFGPETQLAYLQQDTKNSQWVLRLGSIREHLPYTHAQKLSKTSLPIELLTKVVSTPQARTVLMATQNTPAQLPPERIRIMLAMAKQAYDTNSTGNLSGKNQGAAVLFDDGRLVSGSRFDWTQRWNTQGDLIAAIQGFQNNPTPQQVPSIVAVAYYGDEPETPAVTSLGPISQGRGSAETLFITIEDNDTIQIRTLRDYMPNVYISSKVNRNL